MALNRMRLRYAQGEDGSLSHFAADDVCDTKHGTRVCPVVCVCACGGKGCSSIELEPTECYGVPCTDLQNCKPVQRTHNTQSVSIRAAAPLLSHIFCFKLYLRNLPEDFQILRIYQVA